jgi:tRNA dimethylallyltransferase
MFEEPPLDPTRKERLKRYLGRFTREELLRWLAVLDHVTAERLGNEGGRQRIARAVEIALLTGRPLTTWHEEQQPGEPLRFLTFVLQLPRELLNARIDQRVDQMLQAGLVEEVEGLMKEGFDEKSPGMNATGYIELIPYVRGRTSLEAAADHIKRATRRYARRQQTWFRHQLGPDAIMLDAARPEDELVTEIVRAWNSTEAGDPTELAS